MYTTLLKQIRDIYLALNTKQTSYKKYIFTLIHLKQEKGWRLDKAAIVMYNNFFLIQQEYKSIVLLSKIIVEIRRV